MFADELFCPGDEWRFHNRFLHHDIIALHRQMFGKDRQQAGYRIELFLRRTLGGLEIERCFVRHVINVDASLPAYGE